MIISLVFHSANLNPGIYCIASIKRGVCFMQFGTAASSAHKIDGVLDKRV